MWIVKLFKLCIVAPFYVMLLVIVLMLCAVKLAFIAAWNLCEGIVHIVLWPIGALASALEKENRSFRRRARSAV